MVYTESTTFRFRNYNHLRLHVFILSLYIFVYSHQQTIELFEYRQQDSDTRCKDGLLSDLDSVVFTFRVEYYQDPTLEHVLIEMKRTIDKIFLLEKEYNIQTDCNEGNNSECKHIDVHKVEIKLHIKASKDISGATLRGKVITSSQRDIFSNDKIIPEIYDSRDHNASLLINGEPQKIDDGDCNCNVSDSDVSVFFMLESKLSPFYIEMSSKDPYIHVQGKGHVENFIKTNVSFRLNITIEYYPCRMEGHVNTIQCNINIGKLSFLRSETGNCICTWSTPLSITLALVLAITVILATYWFIKYVRMTHKCSTNNDTPSTTGLIMEENNPENTI